jgi:site-specific recombinase XerD
VSVKDESLKEQAQALLEEFQQASLEPMSPTDGVDRYLESRKSELTEGTLEDYERSLQRFLTWCENENITDLNTISSRDIDDYRIWCREESSEEIDQLAPKTMRDQMYLLKSLLEYLASVDAVEPGLAGNVQIPELDPGEGVTDQFIEPERVDDILSYLETYAYATTAHVVWVLACTTGRRPGGVRSLDLSDIHVNSDEPYIEFSHDEDLRLKNGSKSESEVNLPPDAAAVIADYIETVREEITVDGRQPLLTTAQGRISTSTIRRHFYDYTRPCQVGKGCPHDKNPDTCRAATDIHEASKCPSSEPPYSSRHGHITALLKAGCPPKVVSRRCDVSTDVIEKHYDERSKAEKRESRREVLDSLDEDTGGYL